MLIISKFHDYYDSSIGYGGVDKSIIYKREQNIIEYPRSKGDKYTKLYNNYFKFFEDNDIMTEKYCFYNNVVKHDKIVLLICGKIYSCIKLYINSYNDSIYLYNYDELIKNIKIHFGQKIVNEFINHKYYYRTRLKEFFD